MRIPFVLITVASLAGAAAPAMAEWKGKSELGIVFARGNSDTDTANASLGMASESNQWKHGFGVALLRSATSGNKTAERYGGFWQSDYKFSERDYWFGGLRAERDKFSGFDYQASLTTGYGRKFIDTATTKIAGQIGAGYRRSKNAITGASMGDAIGTGQLTYEQALTDTTRVIEKLVVESGSSNTFASNELALQVKMSDAFALSAGIAVRHNSDPPVGLKKTDTLTTLNLVYGF